MENNNLKIQFIKTCLENSSGVEFENNANFILKLVMSDYYSTREVVDGKVDGIIYDSEVKRSFYSIYGPKKHEWKKRGKRKVDEDAEGIKEFLNRFEVELKKWYFVINRELSVDEIEYIKMKFDDPKKVDIITPSKFIELIVKRDVVIETARFLNLINYDIPLSDLQPHAFIKKAFQLLTGMKEWSKEAQLKGLEKILEAIIDLTYGFESHKSKLSQKVHMYSMIKIKTKVPKKKLKSFAYIDGVFVEQNKLSDESFTKNKHNHFVVTPDSLALIYSISKKLRSQLVNEDAYNIEMVLNKIYSFIIRYNEDQEYKNSVI